MAGGYAQAIAVGRATALSAAQEMVHAKHGTDNDDDTTDNDKNTTAKPRQNGASDWALGAYGSTFVLAPSFCLRLGAEDSLLLEAAIRHEGLAVLLQSELSGRRTLTPRPSVYSQLPPLSLTPPPNPPKLSLTLSRSHRGRPELTRYDLGFGAAVAPGLTEHAHRVWTDENAGGSSRNSEAMSMELLRQVNSEHADTSLQHAQCDASGHLSRLICTYPRRACL